MDARDAVPRRAGVKGWAEEASRLAVRARLERAWRHLEARFRTAAASHAAAKRERAAESIAANNPWKGHPGWESEPGIPVKRVRKPRYERHGLSDVEQDEPEEPGYELYNWFVEKRHYRPFRTRTGEIRLAIPTAQGLEIFSMVSEKGELSRELARFVGYTAFTVKGSAVPLREVAVALGALAARGGSRDLPSERVIDLAIRVAPMEGIGCRLDLLDGDRRCVRVRPGSWSVEKVAVPVFNARRHMLPLPEPAAVEGGDPRRAFDLFRFASIRTPSGGENQHLLALTALVEFLLYPRSPKPLLALGAEEGAGKTSTAKALGAAIDPSLTQVIRPPPSETQDPKAFRTVVANRAIVNLDNVSFIGHEFSDDLARLSTGVGLPARRMYTGDDEDVLNARPLLILNGITAAPTAPDLLRRTVFLDVVDPVRRLSESELEANWQEAHPAILGGLLDLAACAAGVLEAGADLQPTDGMAEYTRVGQAVAIALGLDARVFVSAWEMNRGRQDSAAAENPWVSVLSSHFGGHTPDTRWQAAEEIVRDINQFHKETFPKGVTSNQVGNAIFRAKRTLGRVGIFVASKMVRGTRMYGRVSSADGGHVDPLEGFSTPSPAPAEQETVRKSSTSFPPPGASGSTLGPFSLDPLQGSREEGLSGGGPGVDQGGPDGQGPPREGGPQNGVHPGSTLGSTLDSPSEDPPQGGPGGHFLGESGEAVRSSTPAGRGNPGEAEVPEESPLGPTRTDSLRRAIERIGPFVEYPDGTVCDRATGRVLWKPGDPPEKRPRNPERPAYDKPHTTRRF